MGIKQRFADTRTAQERDSTIQVTIPKDLADELGIEGGDEVLWTGEAGEDSAEVHSPRRN